MGGVDGAEGQVGEERAVGPNSLAVPDHLEQLIDQVFAQVVALVETRRGVDVVVVDNEFGVELIGLTVQEPVEPVESPTQGPLVERAGRRCVFGRCQVPFAGAERGVALRFEDFGQRGGVVGDVAELVREASAVVRYRPHSHRVLRAPG